MKIVQRIIHPTDTNLMLPSPSVVMAAKGEDNHIVLFIGVGEGLLSPVNIQVIQSEQTSEGNYIDSVLVDGVYYHVFQL